MNKKSSLVRLLNYARPYLTEFFICLIMILFLVGIDLYQPIIIGNVTDIITENINGDLNFLVESTIKYSIIFAISVILAALLLLLQRMILNKIGQKIIFRIRMDVFEKLQNLDMKFYNNNPIGKLVTRATNDIETLNEMYTSVIVKVFADVLSLLGIIIVMIYINWELSLLTFTVIPLIFIFTYIFKKLAHKNYLQIRSRIASVNSFISEHISGMRIIQMYNSEDIMSLEFKEKTEALRKKHKFQINLFSIYRPSNYLLNILAIVILLYFSANQYFIDEISIGTIVIFQNYISRFFQPIQSLTEQINVIQSASASAEKIFTLLDEKVEIYNDDSGIELKKLVGTIEFKNVWFSYNENDWILKNVSFKVNEGETVAFVGATGAGKSTIQNLITRYYDIQKGEILLDGVNIKNLKLSFLRSSVGQMLQDVFLFTGSIKSNISLDDKDISDDELVEASKYVNADKFISKLDNKYDQVVKERGSSLSSGQRQLLSFARTLAFKPKILILDEATSNIDTETEILIKDAIEKIMKNRTTLIVAHRLSTIQNADKIIVLHSGEIIEQGKHQELLNLKGNYYNLYKLQLLEP